MVRQERVSRSPEMLMLGVSAAVVFAIVIIAALSSSRARTADEQRAIAQRIQSNDALLLSALKDAETGQRGFLLTGREEYLEPYTSALISVPQLLSRLDAAAGSHPEAAQLKEDLKPLVAAKLSELASTVELRRANRPQEALLMVETGTGKALMDQIRVKCAALDEIAGQRSEKLDTDAKSSARTLRLVATGGSALLIAFLAVSTFTVFRGMERRDKLIEEVSVSRNLLSTTLSGIADGVIAADSACRITFINPIAQKLTGWGESEAVGQNVDEVFRIVNETTSMNVENPLQKAISRGETVGLANHTNLISKCGEAIAIDDSAAPLRDERGGIIGAVLVFRDITERREAERRLQNANHELQQFVDSAAHDLRSPLNSVNAMAELLGLRFSNELGPEGERVLGYIRRGLERMQQLLEDLLEFARASHFDAGIAPAISLNGVLDSVLENLKSDIEHAGAKVTYSGLPEIEMQETHALQIFQNLIGNALKYRGSEPPRIHVQGERSGSEWVISVTDNGLGIEPRYFDTIFQPFKRLHGEELPGNGIGLATCRKIVTGYGGRIWVESEESKGSTFYFTVPISGGQSQHADSNSWFATPSAE